MKALTISQPFASLIATGDKPIENRGRRTHYRGDIAIHAGGGHQYQSNAESAIRGHPIFCVLAIARIEACIYIHDNRRHIAKQLPSWYSVNQFYGSEHRVGPYCWILGHVRELKIPIAAKGKQGLWNWEPPKRGLEFVNNTQIQFEATLD